MQALDLLARTLGWEAKSNCARVFTVGSRDERMVVFRRRLLRKRDLGVEPPLHRLADRQRAAVDLGEDAVHGIERARRLPVRQHSPRRSRLALIGPTTRSATAAAAPPRPSAPGTAPRR